MHGSLRFLVVVLWCHSVMAETARWPDERKVGPFIYRSDFSLAPLDGLLREVASLGQRIPQTLHIEDRTKIVQVHLFQRKSTYQNYLRTYFPGIPDRRALFIQQDGAGMVYVHSGHELATDLRHETTHAVLHSLLPSVPLWLDEGLAEYSEVPEAECRLGHRHLKATLDKIRQHEVRRIESLESIRDMSSMQPADYQDAWAWIHFSLHGPEPARLVLAEFLQDIQRRKLIEHFSQRARQAIPDLEQQFAVHFLHLERANAQSSRQ